MIVPWSSQYLPDGNPLFSSLKFTFPWWKKRQVAVHVAAALVPVADPGET